MIRIGAMIISFTLVANPLLAQVSNGSFESVDSIASRQGWGESCDSSFFLEDTPIGGGRWCLAKDESFPASNRTTIRKKDLAPGVYFITTYFDAEIVGKGKIVVQ